MTTLVVVLLLGTGVPSAAGVTHSLKAFITVSSGLSNFPDFMVVGLIDDVLIARFDGNTNKLKTTQNWMEKMVADYPEHWSQVTQLFLIHQKPLRALLEIYKEVFNQSEGLHSFQEISGCEWDDETGEVTGFHQFGYDGEDLLVIDLKKETWIALRPEAVVTKDRWNKNKAFTESMKNMVTQQCPEWGRMFWEYGKSFLLRTELPSVFLLQKTPSSPVSCFATGFYPKAAALLWRRDEEELHEEVDHGEILPNHDGTFQMRVDLNVSSVAPEDWWRYDCVFQLQGVEDNLVTRLDKGKIRTNWGKTGNPFSSVEESPHVTMTTIIIVVAVLALVLLAAVGFKLYRQRTGEGSIRLCFSAERRPIPEDNPELSERLQPEVATQPEDATQPEVVVTKTG
ncbi:major histocompatibility complex class I-related gene protein-like [Antennarius striatus]|uniref:major histocompatibility complex class I-related gene protein-like n=1 Tax=Antennarius striatus TaxID=241820 RepID=UPI0035AFD2E8